MWAEWSHGFVFVFCALWTFPSMFRLVVSSLILATLSHWAAQLRSSQHLQHHLSPTHSLVEDWGLNILVSNLFLWPSSYDLTLTQKPILKAGRLSRHKQSEFNSYLTLLLCAKKKKEQLKEERGYFCLTVWEYSSWWQVRHASRNSRHWSYHILPRKAERTTLMLCLILLYVFWDPSPGNGVTSF